MLIGLQLFFWFLEPCLKLSVTLANLKDAGNFQVHIASLNWNKFIQQNIQCFLSNFHWDVYILHCLVHISFSDFFKSSILINLLEIKTWKTPRKNFVYWFIIPAYVLFSWCMVVKYLLTDVKKWVRIFNGRYLDL